MEFISPEFLIRYGGIALIALIIFAETGLFFCFFLPGDSLLFITGVMCHTRYLAWPIIGVWLLLTVAAVIGSQLGFVLGKRVALLFRKYGDRFFVKQKHLNATHAFYNKHKLMAFVTGRFLPIIRTFMPIVAGIVEVDKRKFLLFNLLGALLWVSLMLFSGYWLGIIFPGIENFLGVITISLVVITSIVVMIYVRKEMKQQ